MCQSENVRTRVFRSVEEREEHIRMMVCKCEGLYTFYKLWIASRILDVTKDEMKLLVKDRVRPVGDIIFRCFSLAFNCKYISFVRDGLNLGKYGCTVNVSAIISAIDPNKCDAPLLDWCLRAFGKDTGYQRITTRSVSEHEKPRRTWTRSSVDALTDCPLETGMRSEDADCGTMWVICCLHLIDTIETERLYVMI